MHTRQSHDLYLNKQYLKTWHVEGDTHTHTENIHKIHVDATDLVLPYLLRGLNGMREREKKARGMYQS